MFTTRELQSLIVMRKGEVRTNCQERVFRNPNEKVAWENTNRGRLDDEIKAVIKMLCG